MNLQIDPLDNLVTICPIQMGWEISHKMYPNWGYGCIDQLEMQLINCVDPTQNRWWYHAMHHMICASTHEYIGKSMY